MPYVVIDSFAGGLDTRKHPMVAPAGTLQVCNNAHITRGGEISKRRALVPWVDATGTKGLAALIDDTYVFGSTARPAGLDPAVKYQQLTAPSGSPLNQVTSYDVFDGKLYVAAVFDDGTVAHFYDGVLVADWFDGRARASFNVVGGVATDGTQASASFEITAASAGSSITAVRVGPNTTNTDNLLSSAVAFVSDVPATAAAVAANINANTVGVQATGSLTITAAAAGGVVTAVRIGSMINPNLLTAPVPFNTSIAVTAAAVASNINANAASPYTASASAGTVTLTAKVPMAADNGKAVIAEKTGTAAQMTITTVAVANGNAPSAYTAQADGGKVTLTRTTKDTTDNGKALQVSTTGTITVANLTAVSGGLAISQVSSIKVDGIEVLGAPVVWASSNAATAAAITAQINGFVSVPEYDAQQDGPKVTLIAHDPGTAANVKNVEIVSSGDISVVPSNTVLTGGFDAATFVPGKFVKTINTKMYSPESSVLHFSGVEEPTLWNSSATGAGFINMANQDGQSQELLAIERYYSRNAIFGRRSVQIWNIDVDPAQNQQIQVLKNTGLIAPQSVEQFGDNDVFFLAPSGVRSLRARDSSTAAAVNDIGTPVDELVVQKIHDVGDDVAAAAVAFIEPIAGRYIIAIGDTVFAYSNFPGGKISAWSTYDFGGLVLSNVIIVNGDEIVVRAGDQLYQVGGPDGSQYDNSLLVVELPLMDVAKPATTKIWSALDLVCEGTWRIYAGFEALAPDARELIATVNSPTLSMQRITLNGVGTHASIRLECDDAGPSRLSNFILHYDLGDAG